MRLSLGLTTSIPLKESLPLARIAEEKGYSRIWVGEDLNGRDVFAYLSVLASETEKILLGTGITSPFVRNLAVIANSSSGLQTISRGRFTLGLGAGGIPEVAAAIGYTPRGIVSEMEEAVYFLKKVFRDGEAGINTRYAHIKKFSLAVAADPPQIYLGVRGPLMLALAGRVADGVILSGPRGYLEEAVDIVNASAEEAGRDPGGIDKVLWNPFVLMEKEGDVNLAMAMVKVMLPSMPPTAMKHLEGLKNEKLLTKLCICGDAEEVKAQLAEYSSMGFSEVVVGPPYGRHPGAVLRTLGEAYGVRY